MKNSYMNNEKCSGVEIIYNLSFFFVLNSKFLILNYYFLILNSQLNK